MGAVTAVAVAVGGGLWWVDRQKYETTDNAFVSADKVTIAPLIDGYVAEVLVDDNQAVTPGQVLVRMKACSLNYRDFLMINGMYGRAAATAILWTWTWSGCP